MNNETHKDAEFILFHHDSTVSLIFKILRRIQALSKQLSAISVGVIFVLIDC